MNCPGICAITHQITIAKQVGILILLPLEP
jgi:hypothetical protein